MSDSIQKIDLEARLKEAGWDDHQIVGIINDAFPPKFIPKVGQVVYAWLDGKKDFCKYVKFCEMYPGGKYNCGSVQRPINFDHCRALTKEEIEGVSDA
jgi:hypothetical protein